MPSPGKTKQLQSWGRYPKVEHSQVQSIFWRSELPDLSNFELPVLPFAYGRSYGDSCLNEGGISLDVSHLQRSGEYGRRPHAGAAHRDDVTGDSFFVQARTHDHRAVVNAGRRSNRGLRSGSTELRATRE